MKKLLVTLFICYFNFSLLSQSCLPEGITFLTQDQIDSFQSDYPGCTEIEGMVLILGNDITNLYGLNVLNAFGGMLWIKNNPNLNSLEGLDNVTSIGGNLFIGGAPSEGNPLITDLSGLNNLLSVEGEIRILRNTSLYSLAGLNNLMSVGLRLRIGGNVLEDLSGLESLNSIGTDLVIMDCDNLMSFEGIGNVTSLDGYLIVSNCNAITNLTGLENLTELNNGLEISYNDQLINLTGLDNLTSVDEFLYIVDNPALVSLEGINNIEEANFDLNIYNNTSLVTCEVESICNYLASPNGTVEIYNNAPGCNSQEEVEDACETVSIDEVMFVGNIKVSPNPFTTSTTLSYELQQPETVYLSVYNHIGQIIYQTQENQPQGSQQIIWKAQRYADGIYYFCLQIGDTVASGKIVKVK
jgi:hypothetical protein